MMARNKRNDDDDDDDDKHFPEMKSWFIITREQNWDSIKKEIYYYFGIAQA